jgi:hypothetical protein
MSFLLGVANKLFMLSVIFAECHYAECHYAECHYAECHYAECHNAECRSAWMGTSTPSRIPTLQKSFFIFTSWIILLILNQDLGKVRGTAAFVKNIKPLFLNSFIPLSSISL